MIIHVLARDYDDTIAQDGRVSEPTARALEQVRESGRKIVLVTGRTLLDVQGVCPESDLAHFCELAEGADEATWEHHRRRGEYSAWLREMIKDPELGQETDTVERAKALAAGETRRRLLQAIRSRYVV